jgi:protein-S-isoprenylcysteine O-methyltransferase Ste14
MTGEAAYRLVLVALAIAQAVISRRYVRRANASATIFQRRDEGLLLTVALAVSYLAYVAAVLVYLANPSWMAWSFVEIPAWVRWAGVVPLLAGAGLHIWGMHHLGTNLTISIRTREEHNLITSGPYRRVRHPLYTAGMVESVGVCLLTANWFVTLSAALFWSLIAYRTPQEEKKLIAVFGDQYRDYMRRVGRFVPRATN